MVGTTLLEIRDHIEDLASADGRFYLRCGRTGERPVPAAGLRFEVRASAREAAHATEQYRSTLRQYDPRLPYYDIVVCQETGPMISPREVCHCGRKADSAGWHREDEWTFTEPVVQGSPGGQTTRDGRDRGALIEFCHQCAAATFEALSERDHEDLERAVMDAYFAHAETIERPDDLCLCLLESLASELDARLEPNEQQVLVRAGANRLERSFGSDPPNDGKDPVETSFSILSERGLVGEYQCRPLGLDPEAGSRTVEVQCSTYALRPRDGRLPVLPIVLALCRQETAWPPASIDVQARQAGWNMTLELSAESTPGPLSAVSITPTG